MRNEHRTSRRHPVTTAALIASVLPIAPHVAAAQDDRVEMVEEIVVSARKRDESLQDTPISISAYSGTGLETRGVENLSGIANLAPNMVFQNNPAFGGSSNSASVYIRGIGQQDFVPTVEPGVGIYVDGVYIARSVGAILDLVDFERVEVLRGPQGTLFGRNTIGGAISITTKKPDEILGGSIGAQYGTDDQIQFKGSLNVPLADKLFMRASIGIFEQDGYVRRLSDGIRLGDSDRIAGRIALRWLASDALEINLAAEGTRARENGPAVTLLGLNFGKTVDPNTPPFADINNVVANLMAGGPPIPCALPGSPPNLAIGGCFDSRYLLGRNQTAGTAPSFSNTDLWGASLSADWQMNDTLTFKSITSYRDLSSDFARDGDGSPVVIAEFFDNLEQQQFSQEFQLLGDSIDSRLQWIAGLYYFHEDGKNINQLKFTPSEFQSGGKFTNESLAAFAQGTFAVTDALSITAGIRYTNDDKSFTPDQFIMVNRLPFLPPFDAPIFAPGTRVLPNVKAKVSFNKATPMVNVAYRWNEDLMTYANYSRGFKSGGFSQRVFPPIIPGITTPETDPVKVIPSFNPETVDAYEIGAKFSAFDNRLRVNAAAFYTDYNDLQVQVFTSVAPIFTNAASASIQGFELEMQAAPGAGWFFEGAIGLTDASFDKINEAETFVSKDNAFERVSKWTLSASAAKDFNIGSIGTLTPRVDWSYRSKFFNNSFNTPELLQNGYHLVNIALSLKNESENLTFDVGIKNLTKENYLVSGVFVDAAQLFEGVFNRGREWFVRTRFTF